jgi:hypothetical protein
MEEIQSYTQRGQRAQACGDASSSNRSRVQTDYGHVLIQSHSTYSTAWHLRLGLPAEELCQQQGTRAGSQALGNSGCNDPGDVKAHDRHTQRGIIEPSQSESPSRHERLGGFASAGQTSAIATGLSQVTCSMFEFSHELGNTLSMSPSKLNPLWSPAAGPPAVSRGTSALSSIPVRLTPLQELRSSAYRFC